MLAGSKGGMERWNFEELTNEKNVREHSGEEMDVLEPEVTKISLDWTL